MAFGTYKPCPGCGSTMWRPVNSVCKACEATLRAGMAVVESKKSKDRAFVFRLTHSWPGIYSPGTATAELGDAFSSVAKTARSRVKSKRDPYDKGVAELPPKGSKVHYFSTYDEKATLWTGSKAFVEALTKLDLEVREALRKAYEEGKREGASLLRQLASGEISVKEINEKTMEG